MKQNPAASRNVQTYFFHPFFFKGPKEMYIFTQASISSNRTNALIY